ncbi:hypothetical protein KUL10_08240 [Glaciecola sp. KUL10]|nr:hypothetical protein KUL10_08240 [Glaciecola sp. KUL10]
MYDDPEQAASYKLASSENRLEAVKEILKRWPSDNASKAFSWISKQHDIESPCKIYAEGDVTLFNLTP